MKFSLDRTHIPDLWFFNYVCIFLSRTIWKWENCRETVLDHGWDIAERIYYVGSGKKIEERGQRKERVLLGDEVERTKLEWNRTCSAGKIVNWGRMKYGTRGEMEWEDICMWKRMGSKVGIRKIESMKNWKQKMGKY